MPHARPLIITADCGLFENAALFQFFWFTSFDPSKAALKSMNIKQQNAKPREIKVFFCLFIIKCLIYCG